MGLPINNSRAFRAPESSGNDCDFHRALTLKQCNAVWLAGVPVRWAGTPGASVNQTQPSPHCVLLPSRLPRVFRAVFVCTLVLYHHPPGSLVLLLWRSRSREFEQLREVLLPNSSNPSRHGTGFPVSPSYSLASCHARSVGELRVFSSMGSNK